LMWSLSPYRSWLYLWVLLSLPIGFFIAFMEKDVNGIKGLIPLLIVMAASVSLLAIYQFHFMTSTYHFRVTGTLLDPNSFAAFLNMVFLPGVAWLCIKWESLKKPIRWGFLISLICVIGGVCATGSRAGIMIMAASLAICFVIIPKQTNRNYILFTLGAALSAWLVEGVLFSSSDLLGRFESVGNEFDPSSSARVMMWQSAWSIIQESPWLGYGLGAFALIYPKYRAVQENVTTGAYVHSDPLQLWLEAGFPALLILTFIFMVVFYYCVQFYRLQNKKEDCLLEISIGLAVLLVCSHAAVNFNFYNIVIDLLAGIYIGFIAFRYIEFKGQVVFSEISKQGKYISAFLVMFCVFYLIVDVIAYRIQEPLRSQGLAANISDDICNYSEGILKFRQDIPGVYLLRAQCLSQQGIHGQAEYIAVRNQFNAAIAANPLSPDIRVMKTQWVLQQGQAYEQNIIMLSIQDLLDTIEINPSYLPARMMLFNIYLAIGEKEKARIILTNALKYSHLASKEEWLQEQLLTIPD